MANDQKTHEELLNAQFVVGSDGRVGSYDVRKGHDGSAPCIFTEESFDQEWYTAMCAMPTLYQCLYKQWVALDALLQVNEKQAKSNPLNYIKLRRTYIRMQNSIQQAMRVATEGTEVVTREFDAEQRMKQVRGGV